jgi:hypothetical protein
MSDHNPSEVAPGLDPEDPLVPVAFKLPPNAVTGSDAVMVIEIAASLRDLLETARRTGRDETLEVLKAGAARTTPVRGQGAEGPSERPTAASHSTEQPFALGDDVVVAISGKTQRALLRAVDGKGRVRITDVLRAVYSCKSERNLEALLKAKDRLNAKLAEMNLGCELRREGETLLLSRV